MKLYFLGFGAVARSLMRMIRDRGTFALGEVVVIDRDERAGEAMREIAGDLPKFERREIRRDNLNEILEEVKAGDIVFNLGDMLGTRIICKWCLERGVHYLSAASDDFPDGQLCEPSFTYSEFMRTREMFALSSADSPATVVNSGMNPGAVSIFVKRAIEELSGGRVDDYAEAARGLGVESIDITDIDDTIINIEREAGVVYSTWSPTEFFTESSLNVEITTGVGVPRRYDGRPVEYAEKESGFVALVERPYEHKVASVAIGSAGKIVGFVGLVVPHEEVVSIPHYLTVRENGKVVYRPETRFVYRACAAARDSLMEIVNSWRQPKGYHLITAKEIASGGESVGVLLKLAKGGAIYVGTRYDIGSIANGETPTVLQVASGCFAALDHVLRHPNSGPKYPEELDVDEFLTASRLPITTIQLTAKELSHYLNLQTK